MRGSIRRWRIHCEMREKIRQIRINSNPDPLTGASRLFDKNFPLPGEGHGDSLPLLLIGITGAFIYRSLGMMAETMEDWADRKKKKKKMQVPKECLEKAISVYDNV
ncbi:hypothetical protein CKAN_00020100 [Cinnamomum micranthum f. kanehirae]|uniref:Uncharacterized protein n=1 Tax=Cinnamomum micranthum f. kanehirae TaxID=337451 RepID=A0A443N0I4_9MAGN|nr:hypothetical protein CKAN_00020100 [Cinnamomum micranthum f. kanehirae]